MQIFPLKGFDGRALHRRDPPFSGVGVPDAADGFRRAAVQRVAIQRSAASRGRRRAPGRDADAAPDGGHGLRGLGRLAAQHRTLRHDNRLVRPLSGLSAGLHPVRVARAPSRPAAQVESAAGDEPSASH